MPNFNPKQYKKRITSISVEEYKLLKIEKAAQKYKLSRNAFIIQCIDFAMENMPDDYENDK